MSRLKATTRLVEKVLSLEALLECIYAALLHSFGQEALCMVSGEGTVRTFLPTLRAEK